MLLPGKYAPKTSENSIANKYDVRSNLRSYTRPVEKERYVIQHNRVCYNKKIIIWGFFFKITIYPGILDFVQFKKSKIPYDKTEFLGKNSNIFECSQPISNHVSNTVSWHILNQSM